MKVQELAKTLKQSPRDLMKFLEDMNIRVKSPNAKLDPQTTQTVRELYEEKREQEREQAAEKEVRTVQVDFDSITVSEFAKQLDVSVPEIMKALLMKGLMLNLNSTIEFNVAKDIAEGLSITLESSNVSEADKHASIRDHLDRIEEHDLDQHMDRLVERPPVITIMGHVDHGKTLLLDTIRKANVVASESGGITQHIGAYQVSSGDRLFTFLDTPGHAAFTALRARGAQVTDITILVVAADEGLKPQTIEALDHAKAAKVPIIVAINKMDKPEANVDRVKQQLAEHDLLSEDWGGKTVMVPVSAKAGTGIDELLDMIQLVADMLELKANPEGPAKGIVIESRLSKNRGPVGTVLVKTGTLKIGSFFVVGSIYGKVRALINDSGQSIQSVLPGAPVEVMGFSQVPSSGDFFEVFSTEKEAKKAAEETLLSIKQNDARQRLSQVSLEMVSQQIEQGERRQLCLLVKADVHGSLEAILKSIEDMDTQDVEISIIRSATGPITQNDVMLAKASDAIVIGFGVEANAEAAKMSADEGVQIKQYQIIYEIVDDIQRTVEGLFKTELVETILGEAEVRDIFSFSKVGTIAGSYVTSGELKRNALARVYRGDDEVFSGKLNSLKRFKEDVKTVSAGFECGIVVDGADFKEGDRIVVFDVSEKKG